MTAVLHLERTTDATERHPGKCYGEGSPQIDESSPSIPDVRKMGRLADPASATSGERSAVELGHRVPIVATVTAGLVVDGGRSVGAGAAGG